VVTLYFNRSRVGVFSTYMVVENLANPADFKVVRVEMEVVDGGMKDMVSKLFEVLVSPTVPRSTREPGLAAGGGNGSSGGNSGNSGGGGVGSGTSTGKGVVAASDGG
ncbi:unnamed protein product, partial [Pylaiella littoralis]